MTPAALAASWWPLLILLILVAWWMSAAHAKEQACQATKRFCSLNGWQLLDHTVALEQLRPHQTEMGWRLLRRYRFEFSPNGSDRFKGQAWMIQGQAMKIETQAPDTFT